MSVLVNDDGFHKNVPEAELIVSSDANPEEIDITKDLIAIEFPVYSDGRGFGIARVLRQRGYKGRLRASGHVLADQYAMARRVGFDEVEISTEMAARQDEAQWAFRSNWQDGDYQSRLGKNVRSEDINE